MGFGCGEGGGIEESAASRLTQRFPASATG